MKKIKNTNHHYLLIKFLVYNQVIFLHLKLNILKLFKKCLNFNIIYNKCVLSLNNKQFTKLSLYCRQALNIKLQNGQILGIIKYSW